MLLVVAKASAGVNSCSDEKGEPANAASTACTDQRQVCANRGTDCSLVVAGPLCSSFYGPRVALRSCWISAGVSARLKTVISSIRPLRKSDPMIIHNDNAGLTFHFAWSEPGIPPSVACLVQELTGVQTHRPSVSPFPRCRPGRDRNAPVPARCG